jgi:L-ascorbate metabolism protein UlaG (beta-lactamase superfamily)
MQELTWIGHSTVLVDLDGVRILTDPLLRSRVAHLRRLQPVDAGSVRDVDVVLVSHGHYDHLDVPSLRRLDPEIPVVVPRGLARSLGRAGRRRIVEVEEGDELTFGDVAVRATPAYHPGGRQLRKGGALGFTLRGSSSVYFAGDTDLFDDMAGLGPVEIALLPVWGWGPTIGVGHLDPRRAAEAAAELRAAVAVPIHWGTYRPVGLSREAALLRAPAESFARHARELAPEVDVRIVPVGGSLQLSVPSLRGAGA